MKKIIRDTSCDLLMMISITISFLILFNMIPMIVQISDSKTQSGEYQNELNMYVYYDAMSNQQDSETSGDADEKKEKRREAAIRKQFLALLNDAAEGNIYISGILKETSDKDSEKIVVYYDSLDEEDQTFFKNKIQNSLFTESVMIRIMSDKDILTTYQEISGGLAELGFACSLIEDSTDLTSQSEMYQFLNKCAYAGAMLLAVVNCVAVSGLWMQRQRREYIIRKAFGYDMNQIMLRIVVYMCRLGGIAAVAALLIQVIYLGLFNGKNLFESYSAKQAGFIVLGMAGLIVLASIRPYLQIRKIHPAKGMADWQI